MPSFSERFRTTPGKYVLRLALGALFVTQLGAACGGEVTPPPAVDGIPTALQFQTQPATTTSGVAISPAVEVRVVDANGATVPDASHTVTIAISSGPTGAQLTGTLSASAVNGVASFGNLVLDRASTTYRLVATASGLSSATSATFTVTPGAASQLLFVASPAVVNGGSVIAPAVQVAVADAIGNVVSSATGSVTLAVTGGPAGATLSGTTTASLVNGIASFADLSIDKSGAGYAFTASTSGFADVTSTPFTVNVGPAARLTISTQPPATVAAGTAITVAATLTDLGGNLVTTATNAVTAAITAGTGATGAILGGTRTVNASGGVATFNTLSVDRGGTGYTMTLSGSGLTAATTSAFDVTEAAATQLAFTTTPASLTSMTPASFAVTVQDASGTTVTSSTAPITIAIASGTGVTGATLGGTLTRNAVNGVATFNDVTIDKAGSGYQLVATATALNAATTNPLAVAVGAAHRLDFVSHPGSIAEDAAGTYTVRILDAGANAVTSATNSITLSIASGTGTSGAVLGGTLTRSATAGVATFDDITIDRPGTGYILLASAGGLTSAQTSTVEVTSLAVSTTLAFTVQPTSTSAGNMIAPAITVSLVDGSGAVVSSASASITLSILPETGGDGAALSGTTTVGTVGGVATFSTVLLNTAGTGYVLVASAAGYADVHSASFDIEPGPAVSMGFNSMPVGMTAGQPGTFVVILLDDYGNLATGATEPITISIAGGTGTAGAILGGTTTLTPSNGSATFSNLTINKAGTAYELEASATGVPSARTPAFDVSHGVAAKLAFTGQPPNGGPGVALSPAVQVSVLDAFDNLVTDATTDVTVAVKSGTGAAGAVFGGTTTRTTIAGIATFDDLTVDRAGNDYQLEASASGLPTVASLAFDIGTGVSVGFAQLVVTPATATIAVSETASLTAMLRDANGNDTPATPLWASSNPGIATVSGAGVVTPLRAGTVTITATQAGLVGRATITITP